MGEVLRLIRILCALVFVAGIAGMIVASAAGNNEGWVVTAGATTAVAALILMTASAVAERTRIDVFEAEVIRRVEDRVEAMVSAGADEAEVRALVADVLKVRGGWSRR